MSDVSIVPDIDRTIRRALTDRQLEIAKGLLALPVGERDLFRAMAAIVACGINSRARDRSHAEGLAGDYCQILFDLIESGARGEHLIYEAPRSRMLPKGKVPE